MTEPSSIALGEGTEERRTAMPTTGSTLPVPKIIHQFWDRPQPPADVAERMQSWRRLHPDWAYIQWGDESAESVIGSHFGTDAVRIYRACVLPAMRADMIRIAALWLLGGVYADADVLALRPLTPLLTHTATYIIRDEPGRTFVLHMHLMVASPGSSLLRRAWDRLQRNARKSGHKPFDRIRKKELNHPSHVTGPNNLARVWEALPDEERQGTRFITMAEANTFIQPSRNLSYVREQGSWKDFKKTQRVVDFARADRIASERTAMLQPEKSAPAGL